LTCLTLSGVTLSGLPCLRYKISDASLYRDQTSPNLRRTRRWRTMKLYDITNWRSPLVKTISVTQDRGSSAFQLHVKEFVPVEGDRLLKDWMHNGVRKVRRLPPYAIADIRVATRELQHFVDTNAASYIEDDLDDTDKLLWNTYAMAFRYASIAHVCLLTSPTWC
jgi:hypothetical protein